MKVGILTIHHTSNYGAVLQSFALSQFIKSLGHDVEIIDYRPESAEKFYWNSMRFLKILPPYRTPKLSFWDFDAFLRYKKYIKFQSFFNKHLPLSRSCYKSREELRKLNIKEYDIIVCGSDQIWSLNTPFRGFDPSFFLDFIDINSKCRMVSYAASFGSTTSLGIHTEVVSSLISRLDYISVRDSNSLCLVNETCKREAEVVLDPTFLGDYEKLIAPPKINSQYILIYCHGLLTELEETVILNYAKANHLTIISVGGHCRISDRSFINADPSEWLQLVRNCNFVFTNTFHGMIFSIIFKRNFMVISSDDKYNKLIHLVNLFGLQERCLGKEDLAIDSLLLLRNIDFESIEKKLQKEVNTSKKFICKFLS